MKRIIVITLIFSIASFLFGASFSKLQLGSPIEELQSEIAFSHYQTYTDIQLDLNKGCNARVNSRIEHAINEQKMLMAEYVQSRSDTEFEEYINLRDQDLLKVLRIYPVNWNKTIVIPACNTKK